MLMPELVPTQIILLKIFTIIMWLHMQLHGPGILNSVAYILVCMWAWFWLYTLLEVHMRRQGEVACTHSDKVMLVQILTDLEFRSVWLLGRNH